MNQRPPERLSTAAPAWCRARPWWPMVCREAPTYVPCGKPQIIVTDWAMPRSGDESNPWPRLLLFNGVVEVRVGWGGKGERWLFTCGGRG